MTYIVYPGDLTDGTAFNRLPEFDGVFVDGIEEANLESAKMQGWSSRGVKVYKVVEVSTCKSREQK